MSVSKFLYRLHGHLVERGFRCGGWKGFAPTAIESFLLALIRFILDRFEMQQVWGVPWWNVREWEWRGEERSRE